jgi:glucan phosphorylase
MAGKWKSPTSGSIWVIHEYFFVSCSLQDMIRTHVFLEGKLDNFHERFAAQLNDTHPSIGVAETFGNHLRDQSALS